MSKVDKLIERIKRRPKDFTWDELVSLLNRLGFEQLQGSGSRVKFFHRSLNCLIQTHKPHPAKIVKHYVINEVLEMLIKEKLI